MDFSNSFELLQANSEEIKKLIVRIRTQNKVSAIELDLLLQKLRDVYDMVLDIRTQDKYQEVPDSKITPEKNLTTEAPPPQLTETPPIEKSEPSNTDDKKEETEAEKSHVIEFDTKEQEAPPPQEKTETKNVKDSDRLKKPTPSINDELANRVKSKDLLSQVKSKPIANLTGAMSLNDKYEIINDLFGGDKSKFENTIQTLNMANDFVEAYNYIKSNFDWDMESPSALYLMDLIRRKLIVKSDEQ